MSIEKLSDCIKNKNVNISRAREAIYNLIISSEECLNVAQIIKLLPEYYPKKISQNTLYRHLNFFLECNLVIMLQDDFKRSYYYPKQQLFMIFSVCIHCNKVARLDVDTSCIHNEFPTAEFITVHKLCSLCSEKNKKSIFL